MNSEIDPDLARILRAVLTSIEPEMEPRSKGHNRNYVEVLQARIPPDLIQALRAMSRRTLSPGGRTRTTGTSVHVERAIRLYLKVLELANAPQPSTK